VTLGPSVPVQMSPTIHLPANGLVQQPVERMGIAEDKAMNGWTGTQIFYLRQKMKKKKRKSKAARCEDNETGSISDDDHLPSSERLLAMISLPEAQEEWMGPFDAMPKDVEMEDDKAPSS
jgi:hypothetical protein